MLLPVLLYYLVFHYGPMYGALIAFQARGRKVPIDGIELAQVGVRGRVWIFSLINREGALEVSLKRGPGKDDGR